MKRKRSGSDPVEDGETRPNPKTHFRVVGQAPILETNGKGKLTPRWALGDAY